MEKLISVLSGLLPMKIMRYHYYRIDKFVRDFSAKYDEDGKRMLDIGAQESPFR
jgi:hypothetical protein